VTARKLGLLVINFGEPREPTLAEVEPFLERIFLLNAGLEPNEAARARARQLAVDRAPSLIEEYATIGGSPLNEQAEAQATRLAHLLADRGHDVHVYSAYQFTSPLIEEAVTGACADRVDTLVALPVYPLCGQSTTVAALEATEAAVASLGSPFRYIGLSGWHHDRAYTRLRADHIREVVADWGLDLGADDTLLYFSAHGTPIKYLREGNRYDRYVEEHCRDIARRLGVQQYAVGFQNHTNRRVAWTQPDNEARIGAARQKRLVVVPISFMHEQSETLAELDHELRDFTEGLGKEFHRVPVPWDDPRFDRCLADLVERLLDREGSEEGLSRCRCATGCDVWCTNGERDLPPSPYAVAAEP
jgi:ferrochelatase